MKKFSVLFLILALAMVMTGTARANYLLNEDFEDDDPNSDNWEDPNVPEPNEWDLYVRDTNDLGGASVSYDDTNGVGRGGSACVVMEIDTLVVDDGVNISCFQEMYAAEGIPYRLTAYANSDNGNARHSIKIEFKDDNDSLIREDIYTSNKVIVGWADSDNPITIDSNGVAPDGTRTVTATVFVHEKDFIGSDVAYFDDLVLTQTKVGALTACELSQFDPNFAGISYGDVNRDCIVDLRDIAALAEYWVKCNAVGCPDCGYGGWDCSGL